MIATAEEHHSSHTAPTAGIEEHGARAALYGVLSHLFFSAPSPDFLQQIADAQDIVGASPLAAAWRSLCGAAGEADAAAVRSEFDDVFVSTGRPPVSLYASSYMAGRQRGPLLAELRDDLGRLGYVRVEGGTEYEDHLSALCDVMRGLIADTGATDGFGAQKVFFRDYVAPWYGRVCAGIGRAERTVFYRHVAEFANVFFTNESEYFDLA